VTCIGCGANLTYVRLVTRAYWERTHSPEAAPTEVKLSCAKCQAKTTLRSEMTELTCPSCGAWYRFRHCDRCGAVNQVGSGAARGGSWRCLFCRQQNSIPMFGEWPESTAAENFRELARRGLLDWHADTRLVGGFTLVGGTGLSIKGGTVCSVVTFPDAVRVVAEVGDEAQMVIPYEKLTDVELGGGATTTGGGFVGGGFGLGGAAEGMLIASALNAATRKTTVNTGMHIGSTDAEVLLHHGELTPAAIRQQMSPLFTRLEAARRAREVGPSPQQEAEDPITQLERLARLRESGILSEEEFQAARARQVRRLTEGS
jgi:hypothetical protein